jgi:hypothetical protein
MTPAERRAESFKSLALATAIGIAIATAMVLGLSK